MASLALARSEFDPPPPGGMGRALGLAVLAHVLLVLALAWGLRWKKDANASLEAELWAAVPAPAAPAPRVAPPEPPAPPPATAKPPPVAVNDAARDAEIVLAEKKKQEQTEREQLRLQAEKKAQAERERKRAEDRKLAEQRRHEAEQRKLAEKKAAEETRRKEAAAKAEAARKIQAEEARLSDLRRKAEIERMTRMAGPNESATTSENAQAAGPSAGYAGRVQARVRPNITFTEEITGNPTAEVEVRTTANGTITSSRLLKSSGVKAWDAAVLRAIEKTAVMPRDTDGRVPSPMILEFRPHD